MKRQTAKEILTLVELVRQEVPQAKVKVDNLMVTHYFTMEELLNICNKYADFKCVLANVAGRSEQLADDLDRDPILDGDDPHALGLRP